jgi:hypothetical protein
MYQTIIDSRVCGIPCQIGVISFSCRAGRRGDTWDAEEYYGSVECEWEILDQRGNPAPWLQRKMKSKDHEGVDWEVQKFYLINGM